MYNPKKTGLLPLSFLTTSLRCVQALSQNNAKKSINIHQLLHRLTLLPREPTADAVCSAMVTVPEVSEFELLHLNKQ